MKWMNETLEITRMQRYVEKTLNIRVSYDVDETRIKMPQIIQGKRVNLTMSGAGFLFKIENLFILCVVIDYFNI